MEYSNYENNIEYYYTLKDGKGLIKEYDYNEDYLIFEGEYLNGEKNGKGKEFSSNGKLKFEGEYLNGKRNGKGKEYNRFGSLLFEGEYLNGQRNGKGKKFNLDGKVLFDGEYLYNYKRKGISYTNEIIEYEGEYLFERKWNGKGYDKNGNIIYELINGTGKGKVKEYDDYFNLIYEGE